MIFKLNPLYDMGASAGVRGCLRAFDRSSFEGLASVFIPLGILLLRSFLVLLCVWCSMEPEPELSESLPSDFGCGSRLGSVPGGA